MVFRHNGRGRSQVQVVVGLSFFMGCVSNDKYRKSQLGTNKAQLNLDLHL